MTYEYRVVDLPFSSLEDDLNKAGSQGWNLVACLQQASAKGPGVTTVLRRAPLVRAGTGGADETPSVPASGPADLAACLKVCLGGKTKGASVDFLARRLGRGAPELLTALREAGVTDDPRTSARLEGHTLSLRKDAKGALWLNAREA